jgi:hypothetical protein
MADGIKAAQGRADINGLAQDHGGGVHGADGMIDIRGIKHPLDCQVRRIVQANVAL